LNEALAAKGGFRRAVFSIVLGLLIAGVLIQLSGFNALAAFAALWSGATGLQGGPALGPSDMALGSGHLNKFQLAQSLSTVTPLLLCGLSVALGLRAGLFNIGAQGQMTMGALAAAAVGLVGASEGRTLPPSVHIPLALCAGVAAGAGWGAIAGFLKAWRGVHEVITTIMLNFIGINIATYLVSHNLKDPHSANLQTSRMAPSALLQPLVPHSNLTVGLILAIVAAVAVTFLIARTSIGYTIRAVGSNSEAAEAAGISTQRTLILTMALSGGLAGLAGAIEAMGVHHRYVDGLAGSYGYDGIAVALLGGAGGAGAIFSALFFGLLASGSDAMQALTSVPAPVSTVVQAIVILCVGVRRLGFFRKSATTATPLDSDPPTLPQPIPDRSAAVDAI